MNLTHSNNSTPYSALQVPIAEIDICSQDLGGQIPKVQQKFQIALDTIFSNNLDKAREAARFQVTCDEGQKLKEIVNVSANIVINWFINNFSKYIETNSSNPEAQAVYIDLTQSDRIELAKICAAKETYSLSKSIQCFQIVSEEARYEIAKISMKHKPASATHFIANYGLKRPVYDLVIVFIKKYSLDLFYRLNDYANNDLCILFFGRKYPLPELLECTKELNALVKSSDPQEVNEWIACYNWMCVYFKWSEEQIKDYMPYAKQILLYRDPNLRYRLLVLLVEFGIPSPSAASKEGLLLYDIVLKPLITAGITVDDYKKIMKILSHSDYEDAVKKENVLRGLLSLNECETLKTNEKGLLAKSTFLAGEHVVSLPAQAKEKSSKQTVFTITFALQALDSIILADRTSLIMKSDMNSEVDVKTTHSGIPSAIDWARHLNQMFTDVLGLDKIQEFDRKYSSTIGMARNQSALLVYAGKLNSLKGAEKTSTLNSLKAFVEAVLEGNYKTWRYKTSSSSHLSTVFEANAKWVANWQQGAIEDFEKLTKASKEAAATKFDPIADLKFSFIDHKHFDLAPYPRLKACLEGTMKCSQALEELSRELATLSGVKLTNANNKSFLKSRMLNKKFEDQLLKILDPEKSLDQKKSTIALFRKTIIGMKEEMNGIAYDALDRITKLLTKELQGVAERTKITNLIVQDTDAWEDLLLCGTEVAASCQRITGDAELNKCLLGYMIDGKNRLVVVKSKNGNGEILARCIMRLLWDAKLKQPVIYQERFYASLDAPVEAEHAINAMFIKRAKDLGLPLVRANDNKPNSSVYPNDVMSLDSSAPFEYVDTAQIGMTSGWYTIKAKYLQKVNLG